MGCICKRYATTSQSPFKSQTAQNNALDYRSIKRIRKFVEKSYAGILQAPGDACDKNSAHVCEKHKGLCGFVKQILPEIVRIRR
jgi:hypothetical protein